MPSGSHAGGGGGHSGGGAGGGISFGGGGGGFHLGGGRHYRRGPTRIYFFGRYYTMGSTWSGLISAAFVLMFICGVMIMIGAMSRGSASDWMDSIEVNYNYYQKMITYAESHPERLKTAKITDIWYSYEYGKWKFDYSIPCTDNPYLTCDGYSYWLYTEEEIWNFKEGDEILVAAASDIITTKTDSTPINYKDTTLEDDGEYMHWKSSYSSGTRLMYGGIAGEAVLLTSIIVIFLTKKKRVEEEALKKGKGTSSIDNDEVSETYYCDYCGNKVSDDATKCPMCGARIKR